MRCLKRIFFAAAALLIGLSATLPAAAQVEIPPCPPGVACPGQNGVGVGVVAVNSFLLTVISWLAGIAFVVAVLFLVIGGFMMITAGGNEEASDKGKKTIINALVGIVIIILSYIIVVVVVRLISGGFGGGGTAAP